MSQLPFLMQSLIFTQGGTHLSKSMSTIPMLHLITVSLITVCGIIDPEKVKASRN